jgi:drug/metabolite transporter (DMT)-like permease
VGFRNFILYATTILIWGSTWLAITYQLGEVDPMLSVAYRFSLAALILFAFCFIYGLKLKFRLIDHAFMALQGVFSFSIGYWLVYVAEMHLASGLVAVITSSMIFMNIFNGWLFIRTKIDLSVLLGATIGMAGILLIFWPEVFSFRYSDKSMLSMIWAFLSTLIYSFGNILVVRNQQHRLPVIQTNAYSMAYGAVIMFIAAVLSGKPFRFEWTAHYMGSLAYLAVFGSVIAFYCYFTLIGEIGPDKAAYGPVVIPAIALLVSSVFEGYRWTAYSLGGVALLIIGNIAVLYKKHLRRYKSIVTSFRVRKRR